MPIEKRPEPIAATSPLAVELEEEIEIDDEESPIIELEDGTQVIVDEEGELALYEEEAELALAHDVNLVTVLPPDVVGTVGSDLMEEVEADMQSRREWVEVYIEGLDLLGFRNKERTEPWDGACGVYSTLLSEPAIRFQAETMSEVFPASGPVKTKVIGRETPEKLEAADRVRDDMNHQLCDVMVEYRSEHERLLFAEAMAGSAFKKVYYDPMARRQMSVFVPAEDVIVPYGATHIESAERVTQILRKTKVEIDNLQASGLYATEDADGGAIDLGEPVAWASDIDKAKEQLIGVEVDADDRYTLYEVHVTMLIPGIDGGAEGGDGMPRPYIITIDRGTQKVLSIYRNWDEAETAPTTFQKGQYFVHYVYIPGPGFYGFGLVHVVGGYARAGTSLIRQLVDAGTLSNLPGGFKARGMRVMNDDKPIIPGEWRDVDVPGGTIRESIVPLPYKEPSATLLALLDKITNDGRRLAGINDVNVSDMSSEAPVGTTLALLERNLKPVTAVQARVHYAMKQEFRLLKKIIEEHAPADYGYDPATGNRAARKQDYALVDVIPVSNPNSSTMAQRIAQFQAVHQLSTTAPQIYDLPYLHRQMVTVLGVQNADKIIPLPEDAKPRDPVSENMGALKGVPLKAFIYQDHEAHIATHMSFMQDPGVMQMIGQTPGGQQALAALQAHIAEHLGFAYRRQLEEQLGAPLPPPDEELPEEIEVQLSRLVADAGRQLTGKHQQEAAAQQAQQQMQDPVMQLRFKEVAIKEAKEAREAKKDQADIMVAVEELKLRAAEMMQSIQGEREKQEFEKLMRSIDLMETLVSASGEKNDQVGTSDKKGARGA